ncbi:MAG: methionyl-tRNA formyltransferase [Flavobacteriales bacterium]|nr:MAG: methionyl-tRNA formyltransferase [Flavobacteriales bacterium]
MEYNTERTPLLMPEYGRMIQSLVEQCKAKESKEERTKMSNGIIRLMALKNPHLANGNSDPQKLWDHLHILSDFELDIDAPYPAPTKEELAQKPKRMEYPKLQGDYKFYGKSILQLIEKAIELEEGDEKDALIEVIANNMKKSYNIYNKEHVTDDVIFRHLKDLSEDRLDLTNIDSLEKSKIYHKAGGRNNRKNNNNNNNRRRFQNKNRRK